VFASENEPRDAGIQTDRNNNSARRVSDHNNSLIHAHDEGCMCAQLWKVSGGMPTTTLRTRASAGNSTVKTQGEIESAVCDGISRFEQEYMGRGPKDIHAYLIGDLLVVRLQGVLTAAEQHLVKTLPPEKGRDLLKQVRTQLIETARPTLEALILDITGCKPRSLHHDISTLTGEEVVIFTLETAPRTREVKRK
jgi:uncharacterized protein YbcI